MNRFQNRYKTRCQLLTAILLLTLLPTTALLAQIDAKPRWKAAGSQAFGKLRFDLYAKEGEQGLGDQVCAANCYNNTFYNIHVKAAFVIGLVCGNETTDSVDFIIKKYSALLPVNTGDPASPPQPLPDGTIGLVNDVNGGFVHCIGNEEIVPGYYPGQKTHNRIASLGIKKLRLFAIQDDGSEVPVSADGSLISPPASTTGNAVNTPSQTTTGAASQPVSNTPAGSPSQATPIHPAPHTDPTTQNAQNAQTQQYINNAQNPNSDAIQRANALNQASINAMKPGGASAQQQQQIQALKRQQAAQNAQTISDATTELTHTLSNVHISRKRDFDPDNSDAFWIGPGGALPTSGASLRQYGLSLGFTGPIFMDWSAIIFEGDYTFYRPSNIDVFSSALNLPKSQISNPKTGGSLYLSVGWGPELIKGGSCVLLLEPAAGFSAGGSYGITYKNNDYSTSNDPNAPSFMFYYGGYLRLFTNNFSFSLGYLRQTQKTLNAMASTGNDGYPITPGDNSVVKLTVAYRLF